ncbi:hypothetical protein [Sphingomonas sp. S-NIH.Pt15_0812]|uniref:hypothetical protein n=1 Tax=Sphingomonas sp. S-NIH.Pt15_0812 TaxID=1920129 RepID=UPI000F7E2A1B|nr:hypothetical protein [Sphingomonas sp. S-NIH.Pt15_0812]
MSTGAIIGLVVSGTLVVLGMLVSRAWVQWVFPLRENFFQEASDLSRSPSTTADERECLNFLMDRATSFRAGWMPVRAAWMALRANGVPPRRTLRIDSEKLSGVTRKFMFSTLAANPFALAAFAVILLITMKLAHESVRPAVKQAAVKLPMTGYYASC